MDPSASVGMTSGGCEIDFCLALVGAVAYASCSLGYSSMEGFACLVRAFGL